VQNKDWSQEIIRSNPSKRFWGGVACTERPRSLVMVMLFQYVILHTVPIMPHNLANYVMLVYSTLTTYCIFDYKCSRTRVGIIWKSTCDDVWHSLFYGALIIMGPCSS
jgi:hypothetical protein